MKLTVKQLKRLIKEQVRESALKAFSLEEVWDDTDSSLDNDSEQLELPFEGSDERQNKLNELEQDLKGFDWYYMMSDDNHVYQTGSKMMSALRDRAKKLGSEGEELFTDIAEEHSVPAKLDIKPWKGIDESVNEEESSVPAAPPVPIHEQGTNACVSIGRKDMRPGNTSLEEGAEEGCHESLEDGEQQEFDFDRQENFNFKPSKQEQLRELEKDIGRYCGNPDRTDEDLDSFWGRAVEFGQRGVELYKMYFDDMKSDGMDEGYTGSPADGGGITGTQATSGAADVVKEEFNKRVSKGLNDLKKDFDASTLLPPSKWHKCKVCKYQETNRPNGICRRCASNGNKTVE